MRGLFISLLLPLPLLGAFPTPPPQDAAALKSSVVLLGAAATADDLRSHLAWLSATLNTSLDDALARSNASSSSVPLSVDSPVLQASLGRIIRSFSHTIRAYHGLFPDPILDLIKKAPLVSSIEPDAHISIQQDSSVIVNGSILVHANAIPTTIQVNPPSWGLDRITHREPGFEGRYVSPVNGGSNVTVYILDTGVYTNHPDFGGRATFGASFSSDGNDDGNGHGTHVAGIVASATYGVAKTTRIVAVKVLGNTGIGKLSDVIAGIEWVAKDTAAKGHRSVVNLSLGGKSTSAAINAAVASSVGQGILFSIAAGNENVDACQSSPQDSPLVMTVGASTENDARASFSNYGSCVDIYAPGTNITSTWPDGGTHVMSGTSQAAPHVSGQMAILLSLYPTSTPQHIITAIKTTSTTNMLTMITLADVNQLLYNGLNVVSLMSDRGDGSGFGNRFVYGGGGWVLVRELILRLAL